MLGFAPEDPRVPIFADSRVRRRRFRIVARQRPAGLEIIQLHAIEKGRLIRLYYFCEVCTIEAYAPGPCWCCQQDFQFREEPETRFDLMRPDGRSPDSEETWNR